MRNPEFRVVEWYRPVLLGRMVFVWLIGVFFIGLGLILSGIAFDPTGRFPDELQLIGLVFGVASTVGGALFGLLGILRVLAMDTVWLLVREDGVVFHDDGHEVVVSWQALQDVSWSDRRLVLTPEDGPAVVVPYRFMGITGTALVARLREVQQQALLGVLRQRLS